MLLLTICIQHFMEKPSRKRNIFEFCHAYIMSDYYNLSKFISKHQRLAIAEWLDQNSNKLNHFHQCTLTDLKFVMIELFTYRPSEIPYIALLLEYTILNYTRHEDLSIDTYIQNVSILLYKHSTFFPYLRYNLIFCKILSFFQIL